jgi:sulfur-carrier protein
MPAEGSTVQEALDRVFAENPLLRSYLLDDQGRLRQHVNVFVNE